MTNNFHKSTSLVSSLKKFFKSLKLLFSGKYFIASIVRQESGQLKASFVSQGAPYFVQILMLQAFARNEIDTTFVDGSYIINASDFIEYMPEVKVVGDNTCKIGMAVFHTSTHALHMHNVTYSKLKNAPKIAKKEVLQSVKVYFK